MAADNSQTSNSAATLVAELLCDFPQRAFFSLLFGLLAVFGSIMSLVFRVESSMFVQILSMVGTASGIGITVATTAEVVKHFSPKNKDTKSNPDQPSSE